jgi:hypothetical protein
VHGYENVWSVVFMTEERMTKRWHGCVGKIGGGSRVVLVWCGEEN